MALDTSARLVVLWRVTSCLYRRPSTTLAALRLLDIVHYACVAAPCQGYGLPGRGLLADTGRDLRAEALLVLFGLFSIISGSFPIPASGARWEIIAPFAYVHRCPSTILLRC